ncbi:MAG: S8 family serine peptidase [Candidatus Thorarchaeota archaeon]
MKQQPPRPKLIFLTIGILVLLFLPMVPVQSHQIQANLGQENTIIEPELAEKMNSFPSNQKIPIVVNFPDGYSSHEMRAVLEELDLQNTLIRHVFSLIPVVSLYAGSNDIETLASIPIVERLGFDSKLQLVSNDQKTKANDDGGLGYTHPDEILDTDSLIENGFNGTGIQVAVLDSGVQGTHPDLENQLMGFKDLVSDSDQDDMDPSDGIDAYDDNGHGTVCSWLVAGSGEMNGGKYTGIAPGADLLIVKVLDEEGAGDDSVIAEGIEFAVDSGSDVISLSLGGPMADVTAEDPSMQAAKAAIEQGLTVVIAAGNTGPAAYTINSPGVLEEAITVGSSADGTGVVAFSSRGPVNRQYAEPYGIYAKPDIIAPGLNIMSGRADSANYLDYPVYNQSQYGSYYTQFSGTSASTPQVAGLVALLMSKYSHLRPIETKTALMAGATDLNQDSMEQGWGLANATMSSELLSATDTLTIMTPRSYPTLPGSKKVLIVGEDREDQDVSVLSTDTRGNLNIQSFGNASQFIQVPQSVTVEEGYSYFGISLSISDDLPLSSIGAYTGEVVLTSGEENITSIELEFSITTYGGKLMVDMAHHSADDPDDPSYYRYFTEYLKNQGILLSEFPTEGSSDTIDTGALSTTETFMIMDTETTYGEQEIDAIHEFVENGGTLFILSEFYDNQTGTASFAIDYYNMILEPYGIQCEEFEIGRGPNDQTGLFYGEDYGGVVENHSLVEGVENLYILSGSTLSVNSSVAGAEGLFWYSTDKEHALIAKADYGDGRVIAVSDGSTLYDDILYDAIRGGADNLQLLRNIAGSLIPERPRIFDIQFDIDQAGEMVSIVSYVFDDDLDDVSMTITGPSDEVSELEVTENLGYKFRASTNVSSGGFYEVLVTATDFSGNTRTAKKVFLIPVSSPTQELTNIVTILLIGIVVVGLVYVMSIKFNVRDKLDSEWEIEVEEDEGPLIE